jgi:hypothetical protein
MKYAFVGQVGNLQADCQSAFRLRLATPWGRPPACGGLSGRLLLFATLRLPVQRAVPRDPRRPRACPTKVPA